MKSLYVVVPIKESGKILEELKKEGLMRRDMIIDRDERFLYIPVLQEIEGYPLEYEVIEREIGASKAANRDYRDILDISEDLIPLLPRSFDIVGKIALMKIPEPLLSHEREIGNALLRTVKSIDTVARDDGVKERKRIRDLKVIAGKESLFTIHKEHGITLEMDLSKVYYSPRLATERWRVVESVQEDETIIDMFSGVGPFSIMIAKHRRPKRIYAIDINPDAVEHLLSNIKRNKVQGIDPICGDAGEIVPGLDKPDRIIMNLPHSAYDYLEIALSALNSGGIIHYYEILSEEEKESRISKIMQNAESIEKNIEIQSEREVHTYSAKAKLYSLELKVLEK
jgi:tRNA (guanine37-N1)-methyltransferase